MKEIAGVPIIENFDVKPYDWEGVFSAVGKIIKNAQEFEQDYKDCLKAYGVKLNDKESDSLFECNKKMFKNKHVTVEERNVLARIAFERNRINHSFFIELMKNCHTEQEWLAINKHLKGVMTLINEGRDIVENLKNKDKPYFSPIRTIFDGIFNKRK